MGGHVEGGKSASNSGGGSRGSGVAASAGRRLLLRGESMVASVGIAVAALLLAAMGATAWWIHTSQQASRQAARTQQVQTAATLLAHASEVLLSRNELSAVRTLVADAGRACQLAECRIVLPDGQVVAATEVSRITAKQLPGVWPAGGAPSDSSPSVAGGYVRLQCAMSISGRGGATLEVAAPIATGSADWQMQAGIGGIGAVALFLLLLIYRGMRLRLRALGAIREALAAAGLGNADPGSLSISSDLGPEAGAWNNFVTEIDKLRKQSVADKARHSLGSRHEARTELESACDALTQGLLLIDAQNQVKYANGAAAVFLRANRDEMTGANVERFIQVQTVLDSIREVAAGKARRRFSQDIERQEDGATGVLRFTVRPVRRDDKASAMLTIEDITQQRVAETARNNFVAQATHELRTPLTNIRLYVETAIEEGEADAATRARCLNVINGEARRLERIVGEMLSVAEIEAGSFKINRDDVRLDALFAELQADYQHQAADKQIDLKFKLSPKLPVLRGDRDKIMLALHNLVGNALKYTPQRGSVVISAESAKGQLTVEVKDSGIGIGPEDQQRVFDRFYRAKDPRVAKITGTGLGLTLAREVARLHGGDITLESEVDRGSTFTLTLPAPAEAA